MSGRQELSGEKNAETVFLRAKESVRCFTIYKVELGFRFQFVYVRIKQFSGGD